jgi:tight adherence protein C
MYLVLAVAGGFGFVALMVIAITAEVTERGSARATLRTATEGLPLRPGMLHPEDALPFYQRILLPALQGVSGLGRRISPVGYFASVQRRLVLAGRPGPEELDRFLAGRVITLLLLPAAAAISYLSPTTRQYRFLEFLILGLFLLLGPEALLNRRAADRQDAIRSQLSNLLDLLSISVEAGLGFDQALSRAVSVIEGPVSEEFGLMLAETRVGASRRDALEALDQRTDVPELHSFVLALVQADSYGVSISQILRTQAEEMRVARRQIAQEKAQKAPVKMLFPLVFCILPALFIVVVGPAAIEIYRTIIQ